MENVTLYEEYRLIERSEVAVNRAWKGAHLLLFFLAFVFGSFCTFCFHMLMYLFDEKCVLFPKLLSLTSLRHNVIYEFVPPTRDLSSLPVDFVSTQWVEKSTCALPTYVPLVSGIFGLMWTTMFLMCSTGSRTLTGLQRPWRVLPPVFLFSLLMGALCVYSSAVTHYGLHELCIKLGEITGSSTCTYAVNVATLTYERRIRGVYQATRLTILSAWLHTACWICSALLAVLRVLLFVDFHLVRVRVTLHGNVDRMLERNETQIRTISPDTNLFNNLEFDDVILNASSESNDEITELLKKPSRSLFARESQFSELSLVPEESNRLARLTAYEKVDKENQFIVKMIFDMLENLNLPDRPSLKKESEQGAAMTIPSEDDKKELIRQSENQEIMESPERYNLSNTLHDTEYTAQDIGEELLLRLDELLNNRSDLRASTSRVEDKPETRTLKVNSNVDMLELKAASIDRSESVMLISDELKSILRNAVSEKEGTSHKDSSVTTSSEVGPTSVKNSSTQTVADDKSSEKPRKPKRVMISESIDEDEVSPRERRNNVDKETQTPKKEKQD